MLCSDGLHAHYTRRSGLCQSLDSSIVSPQPGVVAGGGGGAQSSRQILTCPQGVSAVQ
jgi:hypothetical protein